MALIGSVSYSCHVACLSFIGCMHQVQEGHYKDFDLRNFSRQLFSDANRSTETFRHCEREIRTYLTLPEEEAPLWNSLLERIKY